MSLRLVSGRKCQSSKELIVTMPSRNRTLPFITLLTWITTHLTLCITDLKNNAWRLTIYFISFIHNQHKHSKITRVNIYISHFFQLKVLYKWHVSSKSDKTIKLSKYFLLN